MPPRKEPSVAAPASLPSSPISCCRIAAGDLRRDQDLTTAELRQVLDLAREVKARPREYLDSLRGHSLALLFEKPSLRTRLTFELAIAELGGSSVTQTGMIAEREPLKDVARNLAGWVSAIVARTYAQQTVDDLAHWADVPVINALSDLYHPCQILADLQTIEERLGSVRGAKIVFVGDGNNVAHSLMLSVPRLGGHFVLAHPRGYEPKAEIVAEAKKLAAAGGGKIRITLDPEEAVEHADAVYTDVWASMGQEHEAYERMVHFEPYRVDENLMSKARKQAIFMHCLPAKRGQEATDGVIESRHSAVFQQAENRLHAQKALLLLLIGG